VAFTKTWRVQNTGGVAWPSGTKLVFVKDNQMDAASPVAVPEAQPGETVDISVDMVAPNDLGSHRGGWRLQSPTGKIFGDQFWVLITVASREDIAAGDEGVKITTTVNGETVTWTLPCGSLIPPGAVCVCNCVSVPAGCGCVGDMCSCVDNVTYTIHYWYPN
jgi:hypothetical protein